MSRVGLVAGRELAIAAVVVMAGGAMAGGLFWALLNVPESNALALAASAVLVVLAPLTAWLAAGCSALILREGPRARLARRTLVSIPAFVVGLALFALLWWFTGAAGSWWQQHNGEIDAFVISRVGTARTAWLHSGSGWLLWFIRWALGTSIVVGLLASTTAGGVRALPRGLWLAVRPLPLVATTVAGLLIVEVLWRLAEWTPSRMPPVSLEPLFVAVKLAVVYVAAAIVATMVLRVYSVRAID